MHFQCVHVQYAMRTGTQKRSSVNMYSLIDHCVKPDNSLNGPYSYNRWGQTTGTIRMQVAELKQDAATHETLLHYF